jgi:molecular chaperone GrpE
MKKTQKINKTDQEVALLEERLKRVLADYDNLEKRIKREKEVFVKRANAVLLDKFLISVDELCRCQKHLKDKGLGIAIDNLIKTLKSEGVEKIEVKGKEFDPEIMDAVELVEGEKNKVIEVENDGYLLNNSVLRPAKVKVGAGRKEK